MSLTQHSFIRTARANPNNLINSLQLLVIAKKMDELHDLKEYAIH